jgi:ankyrin repeat protein
MNELIIDAISENDVNTFVNYFLPIQSVYTFPSIPEEKDYDDFNIDTPLDNDGNTALILSCKYISDDITELLLYNGANPYKQNNYGESALYFAYTNQNDNMLKLIQEL